MTKRIRRSERTSIEEALKRFEEKIQKSPEGCWLWTGSTSPNGYAQFTAYAGNICRGHRFSYEHYKGPIGDLLVLHTCDVKHCVNPDHLYLGTPKQNMEDAIARGRWKPRTRNKFMTIK